MIEAANKNQSCRIHGVSTSVPNIDADTHPANNVNPTQARCRMRGFARPDDLIVWMSLSIDLQPIRQRIENQKETPIHPDSMRRWAQLFLVLHTKWSSQVKYQ